MVVVRRALPEDSQRVFNLSNDPLVRAVSFSQEAISWETHVRWFQEQLKDRRNVFYLAFSDTNADRVNEFVGQVRFKALSADEAEVSLSVTEQYRGKGWGKACLTQAIQQVKLETNFKTVRARIKRANEASIRFFLSSGFAPLPANPTEGVLELVLPLSKDVTNDQ